MPSAFVTVTGLDGPSAQAFIENGKTAITGLGVTGCRAFWHRIGRHQPLPLSVPVTSLFTVLLKSCSSIRRIHSATASNRSESGEAIVNR